MPRKNSRGGFKSQWRSNWGDYSQSNRDEEVTIDGLERIIRTIRITPYYLSIPLSFTSRGIGLTLFDCIDYLSKLLPKYDPPIFSLYRVSLLQLAAKYQCARSSGYFSSDLLEDDLTKLLKYDDYELVQLDNMNLTPIVELINCCGVFEMNKTTYFPSIINKISPFTITIKNLREIVLLLSNPDTDVEVRKKFLNFNSIVGAQFEDESNPVLVNPDEIIPPEYNSDQMSNDFLRVKAYLSNIRRKSFESVSRIKFDKYGSPGQLLSTEVTEESPRISSIVKFDIKQNQYCVVTPPCVKGKVDEWFTARNLNQEVIYGVIALCGEIEIERPSEYIVPWMVNRNPRCAVQKCHYNRSNIMHSFL